MGELTQRLEQQADEIAKAGHNGWGNTMREAAVEIERLTEKIKALEEVVVGKAGPTIY